MPEKHRRYLRYNADDFRLWAKSIGNSTTLPEDVVSRDQALPVLDRLVDSVSTRLKKHCFLAGQLTVEIKYSSFRSVSHQMLLNMPTSNKEALLKNAVQLFDELWDGSPVRLLGIRTGKFQKEGAPYQINLFDYQSELAKQERQKAEQDKHKKEIERKKRLEDAIGKIEKKYGSGFITKGFTK